MSTEIADVAIARSIRNPVLTGFHPDPSILRVDDDYYLATSTFEWYPGVRVHHSKDLVHWRELGGIITERRLLDLRGCGDSNGIWAPDLTYHDGLFHLVYSDVASFASGYWDAQNFLTTARPSRDRGRTRYGCTRTASTPRCSTTTTAPPGCWR